ncbi:MAG: DUF4928 family protein [Planctomycetaceae bacterium]|nr:DUF4928 family protein [Planctomycetaceae bacterium]
MDIVPDGFVEEWMKKGDRFIPARLQAALALLEKLRSDPVLDLTAHLASKGSSGLQSHETWGNRAHKRLQIEAINKNHGRRSSSLQDWGQELLDLLKAAGFENASKSGRSTLLDDAQRSLAEKLRYILDQEPLEVRLGGKTAETVVGELLKQAEEKGKAGDVAQYLVGAKLKLRFKRDIPANQANRADRKCRGDAKAQPGDFVIENAVIEVAVGLPDDKHMNQIADALEDSDFEVWLLTRSDRVGTWKRELEKGEVTDVKRVVVTSVEAFIGQNISELSEFSSKQKTRQLKALVDLYNKEWVDKVGLPGIKIIVK